MSTQPKSLALLFTAEFVERFSYWGLQSLLVLYLAKSLAFPTDRAYVIYGTFAAFAFSLSSFGGVVADKLLGFRNALVIGILFAIAGNLCLALPHATSIYTGLTLIICGVALFTPSNSNLLGTFYEAGDLRRTQGFTLFYVGTNLGGLIGPVVYGILLAKYGWHSSFLVSTVILALWLVLFLFNRKLFVSNGLPPTTILSFFDIKSYYLFCPSALVAVFMIWFLIQHVSYAGGVLGIVGAVILIYLISMAVKSTQQERHAIFTLLAMMFFCLLFFANELQVNSSLLLFTEQHVNRKILGWQIPTNTFAALEPLSIILLAPLISRLWSLLGTREPSAFIKLAIGFLLESASFFVFSMAAHSVIQASQKASIGWLLSGNLLLGAGELCLMPIILSAITKLAPKQLKGAMMGALYLAISFSSYFSGLIATLTIPKPLSKTVLLTNEYAIVYDHIALFALVVGLASLIFLLVTRHSSHVKSHV